MIFFEKYVERLLNKQGNSDSSPTSVVCGTRKDTKEYYRLPRRPVLARQCCPAVIENTLRKGFCECLSDDIKSMMDSLTSTYTLDLKKTGKIEVDVRF